MPKKPTVSAGDVPPSSAIFVVVDPAEHPTLDIGDRVVMVEAPRRYELYLLRPHDNTLHMLTGDGGDRYVTLRPL